MVNNPFAPPPIDVAGPLGDIGKEVLGIEQQRRLQNARSSAMKLMQGGDYKGGAALLMGIGDVDGMKALTGFYRAMNPQMNPYQAQEAATQRARDIINSYPQSKRDFFSDNPEMADPAYKEAMQVLTGGQVPTQAPPQAPAQVPAQAPQPTQTQPTGQSPSEAYRNYKLIQSGKMATPEVAQSQIGAVDQMLDNTKEQLQKALDNPHLGEAFGGVVSMLKGSPTGGITGMWPGSYNVLPEWATAGTTAADAHNQVEALKDQLSTVVINNMKEASGKIGGSTGLGRVLQAEFAAWGNFFGSLKNATSVEQAKQTIQNAIKFIDQSKARHKSAYEQTYGSTGGVPTQNASAPEAVAPGVTTMNVTGLPETAPPSAGNVPVQGAATLTRDPRGPYLSGKGTTTATNPKNGHKLILSPDGTQWLDAQTGQPVP